MTTVYFIRHGESEGNLFRICQGHDDELLSAIGRKQAAALGRRFRLLPIRAVYTSDLYRAAATAQPIAKPHHLQLIPAPQLREICLGEVEGLSWGEVYRRYPEMRRVGIHDVQIPGRENTAQVAARVLPFMERVARKHDRESICLVSHGGTIGVFLKSVFPDRSIHLAGNTSVTTLRYDKGAWELVSEPDTLHLDKAGIPAADLFGKNILDLYFRDFDCQHNPELLSRFGRDSWQTVFGSLRGYDDALFCLHGRRMARTPHMTSLCMDGENIAGVLLLDPEQGEPEAGHISLVYLEPAYRHRGLGYQLIGYATVQYRTMGRRYLQLHVDFRNRSAIDFYRKCGFKLVGMPNCTNGQLLMRKNILVPSLFSENLLNPS